MPYASGCRGCGDPSTPDGKRCETCKAARRSEEAAVRAHRRENGLCLTCGAPVAPTKQQGCVGGVAGAQRRVRAAAKYCRRHLEYYRRRSAA